MWDPLNLDRTTGPPTGGHQVKIWLEAEKLQLDFRFANANYFLRQSSSGYVLGPKNSKDGIPRHITIPIDEESGEVKNIHMKSGREGLERWTIRPNRIVADVSAWVRKNSNPVTPEIRRRLNSESYVISLHRVMTTFQIVQSLGGSLSILLGRGFCLFHMVELKDGPRTKIQVSVNPSQARKLLRVLRRFGPRIESISKTTIPRLVKLILKLHLVSLDSMSGGDVCVVIPRLEIAPLVVFKSEHEFLECLSTRHSEN